MDIYTFTVCCPAEIYTQQQTIDVLESFVAELGYATECKKTETGGAITVYCEGVPDATAVTGIKTALTDIWGTVFTYDIYCVSDGDWLRDSQIVEKDIRVGGFCIHQPKPQNNPQNISQKALAKHRKKVLSIEAGHAFGVGTHATTRGCLRALEEIAKKQHRSPHYPFQIADIGTGTGILALAAAKIFPRAHIIASDIETQAVTETHRTLKNNGLGRKIVAVSGYFTAKAHAVPPFKNRMRRSVSHQSAPSEKTQQGTIRCVRAMGLQHTVYRKSKKCDIIFANILAQPLRKIAFDVCQRTCVGGYIILSGMLPEHTKKVIQAYKRGGCKVEKIYRIEGWHTVLLQKI